ncbi:MAG TPA: hypothetical protein VGK27_13300 [Candidatus Deferrimicrobiaceae bacterium]|jgi:hypothetical protein
MMPKGKTLDFLLPAILPVGLAIAAAGGADRCLRNALELEPENPVALNTPGVVNGTRLQVDQAAASN